MALIYPLSFQLYSGRNFPPLDSQLRIVADAGFSNVEAYGGLYCDVDALSRGLTEYGLSVKSGHFDLDSLENDFEAMVRIADLLGITTLVAPYLDPNARPATISGWRDFGARLAILSDRTAKAGRRFAWHNHDYEFTALEDGSYPIEHVLGQTVLWEADIAWMLRAKVDAAHWLQRYEGRVPLIHVKDIAPPGNNASEDGWADIGAGVAGWDRLWPLCVAAGAETMVAEHDNPSDFGRFARFSADTMRRLANN